MGLSPVRIRLSFAMDAKNKTVDMGFRQKNSQIQLVSIQQLLSRRVCNQLILSQKLTELWTQYSAPKQLGHIELVSADNGVAMLLRYKDI